MRSDAGQKWPAARFDAEPSGSPPAHLNPVLPAAVIAAPDVVLVGVTVVAEVEPMEELLEVCDVPGVP